jgi:iron(III) transport system permease protein
LAVSAHANIGPAPKRAAHLRLGRGIGRWSLSIPLPVLALAAALVCTAPAATVLALSWTIDAPNIVSGALLRDSVAGTLGLVLVGGAGALILGALAAGLIALCRFPGRDIFAWLLAAPLAAPSYVLAYAYSSLTWAGGPIPFPIAGFWGAAFVYAVGLYPYVYLAVWAGLASHSSAAIEAARTLGADARTLVLKVVAPLARPSLVAGGALACMEIAADYGAAQHFGVTTLSTSVFRAWYALGSVGGALQLASILLLAALMCLLIERAARGRAGYGAARARRISLFALSPIAGRWAFGFCAGLFILGAGLPLAWLARLAVTHADFSDLAAPLFNTLMLAGGGALATLALAAIIAGAGRRARGVVRIAPFAASLGYAAPGAVIALGALVIFAAARDAGLVGGLGGALALAALIWTYAARFAAAGAQPIEAGLAHAPRNVDAAAASLGAGPWRRLLRIDLPIAAPSLFAAAAIVFVEIVKELPATLILRPFNFDTLAVKAYAYASDERLLEAAMPALLIFAAGLAPMLWLARQRARP